MTGKIKKERKKRQRTRRKRKKSELEADSTIKLQVYNVSDIEEMKEDDETGCQKKQNTKRKENALFVFSCLCAHVCLCRK